MICRDLGKAVMKKITIAIASATTLIATHVMAADMPVKARPAPPPSYFSWAGLYVGGHVGFARSANDNSTADLTVFGGFFAPPGLPFDTGGNGFLGGGQVGYNWEVNQSWLIGIEADVSGTRVNGSQTYNPIPPGPGGFAAPPSFVTMSRNVDWLASLRGRLGFTWDRWLVYGTGGVAWSHADYFGQDSRGGGGNTDTASFSKTSTGWVAGAGLEYALAPNWSIRAEYLYYNTAGVSQVGAQTPAAPPIIANFNWDRTKLHVVRLGINYLFGH
jgi:outer membrane immunogenic protein